MNYFKFLVIFLLYFSFSCQSKTGSEKKSSNVVRLNIKDDPKTLDPRKSRFLNERNIVIMLFDGLTRVQKNGKAELSLAQDVDVSEDGLCYTFALKDTQWSNGDKISGKDFIYAWQTALSPSFLSENAYQLFCIKNAKEIKEGKLSPSSLGVIELDEKTIQIQLQTPVPYFLELLSSPIFFPVHHKMDEEIPEFISSGPFMLKEWKHNDYIELVRNPNYFDKNEVKLSSIYLTMVPEETEMRMFENNELDWAGSPLSEIPSDLIRDLIEKNMIKNAPMAGTRFFRINTEKGPLSNPNIRRALSLSIHRNEIVKHIIQGNQVPALQFLPTSRKSYFKDGDRDGAKVLFQKGLLELGLSWEDFPKISILCTSTHQNRLLAQAVQQDWKQALGIEIEIEVNEAKVYYSRLGKLDYQVALGSWIADYLDPESFLEVFKYKNDSTNNTGWENKEYSSLLDKAKILVGSERKTELSKCESILMKDMPLIPLYHLSGHYLQNPSLQDVFLSPLGNLDFKWAYVDSEIIGE